jgi:hypothetical protein
VEVQVLHHVSDMVRRAWSLIEVGLCTTPFLLTRYAQRDQGRLPQSSFKQGLKSYLGARRSATLRCIARGKKLPRWGNLRTTKPFSTDWGLDRGMPIDRYYARHFFERHREYITGDVLEVQHPLYTEQFGRNISRADSVDIDPRFKPTFVCDLARAEVIPPDSYDCFLLPFTLAHLRDLEGALRTALRVVRPGGSILAVAPALTPLVIEYPDYWRFSRDGLRILLERVWSGCEITVEAYGNCLAVVAEMLGLAAEELSPPELDVHDSRYPLLLTAVCRKPGGVK